MQTLRRAHALTRFVLVWFVLAVGAACAAPLVKPQAMTLICSGAGGVQLIQTDDGAKTVSGHTLECPLCATPGAPPPAPRLNSEPAQPLAHVRHSIPAAHLAARTAAPLPARGPPFAL